MKTTDQVLFIGTAELVTLHTEIEHLRFLNAEERETVAQLSALLVRAALQLEAIAEIGDWNDPEILALAQELRKAAE